jgi:dipeptidyl aminopeptidase/acylaminoacyl peptidase
VSLIDDVRLARGLELAVSAAGTMVYAPSAGASTLQVVSRDGRAVPLGLPPGRVGFPRVSPDGRRVAFTFRDGNDTFVRVHDLQRGGTIDVHVPGTPGGVAWRPASAGELAVPVLGASEPGIYLADLGGAVRRILAAPSGTTLLRNGGWSPDGRLFAYTQQEGPAHDIRLMTVDEPPVISPLFASALDEYGPRYSPDGQWIAFTAATSGPASGNPHFYVARYPAGERVLVGAGANPVWSPDGRELFFAGDHEGVVHMMAVPVAASGDSLVPGEPRPLFSFLLAGTAGAVDRYETGGNSGVQWDVFPDGQRFLMVRTPSAQNAREIVVVRNFTTEIRRLLAGD